MTKKHDIIWLTSADSTNKEAQRRISDIDNLSVLSATEQTEGRGQRGNTWSSESGKNLLFSVVLKFSDTVFEGGLLPEMNAHDQFVISEAASLAIVDLLAENDIEAKIKWPNDIYVNSRKICGILIENSLKGPSLSYSIIGIGLNVNQTSFDPTLPNPTSISLETGNSYDLKDMLERYIEIFCHYISRYCNPHGGYAKLRTLYLSQMWRKGEISDFIDRTKSPEVKFKGTIAGLSDIGHLLIKTTEGELREFSFQEVSYII